MGSFVLWYSIVPFQWRKVWKRILSSLGIKAAVPIVLTIALDLALTIVQVGKASLERIAHLTKVCGFSVHGAPSTVGVADNQDSLKIHFSSPSSTGLGLTGIVIVTVVPFPSVLSTEILPP